jgi:hypothetical protein
VIPPRRRVFLEVVDYEDLVNVEQEPSGRYMKIKGSEEAFLHVRPYAVEVPPGVDPSDTSITECLGKVATSSPVEGGPLRVQIPPDRLEEIFAFLFPDYVVSAKD